VKVMGETCSDLLNWPAVARHRIAREDQHAPAAGEQARSSGMLGRIEEPRRGRAGRGSAVAEIGDRADGARGATHRPCSEAETRRATRLSRGRSWREKRAQAVVEVVTLPTSSASLRNMIVGKSLNSVRHDRVAPKTSWKLAVACRPWGLPNCTCPRISAGESRD
jgi:hypothetical protein